MQIVKEKSLSTFSAENLGDVKNTSIATSEINTMDMIGLSWIFYDYPSLEALKQGGKTK